MAHELEWDAAVDASAIGVTAHGRTVTLTGSADTYRDKLAAERAAKWVRGVKAVANDIEVRPKSGRTDADIARDIVCAFELRSTVPDNVQAAVHHGDVTLSGEAMWEFQRRDAERPFVTSAACAGSSTGSARHQWRRSPTFGIESSRPFIAVRISTHVT